MGACSSKDSAAAAVPTKESSSNTSRTKRSAASSENGNNSRTKRSAASSENGNDKEKERLPRSQSVLDVDKSNHNVLVKIEVQTPLGRSIEDVYDGVHDGPELGSGISGIVRKVTHKATGIQYAVKKLDLGQAIQGSRDDKRTVLQQLRDEIAIMCQLDHPNVVRLEEVYESPTAIYLIQELCSGGELFDRLEEQENEQYTEAKCARLMKQMIDAVRYIHSKGIIHRDLKLENFIFTSKDADSQLRMIDFGLSKHFVYGENQNEAVGSTYTVAPEVIRGEYNEKADIWSIGVITFLLLSGDTPFGGAGEGKPLKEVRDDILAANYYFDPEYWGEVSEQGVDFVKSLLVLDPSKRPTAKELQQSDWIRDWANADRTEEDKTLNPNIVNALVGFKEQSDMTKLLSEVLSFTLLPEQLEELRKQFELLDPEGRGELSLGALKRALLENAEAGALGALTEEEVEDIFDAMRVRKSEMRIHWHEFIAAALSLVEVDDKNLELAFSRLDTENKGYLEMENVLEMMGGHIEEEKMREMWGNLGQEGGSDCNARITKEEFKLLMKGQKECKKVPVDAGAGRAVSLPEHTHDDLNIESSLLNIDATPLVVNRQLYRAHRQTRLAVLEATRKFEEEQMKRTAKKLEESLRSSDPMAAESGVTSMLFRAGLVMRHSETTTAPTESVREMVRQAQKDQQARIDKAMKKSGRVRLHGRKKSFSDVAHMIAPSTPPSQKKGRKGSMDEMDGTPSPLHQRGPSDPTEILIPGLSDRKLETHHEKDE